MNEREIIINKILKISSMDRECLRRMELEILIKLYEELIKRK